MLTETAPAPVEPVSVGELKAYLRIEDSAEDAVLAGLIRSARGLCEAFTGRMLIARGFTETLAGRGLWQRLGAAPFQSVDAVERLDPSGGAVPVTGFDLRHETDGAALIGAAVQPGERLRVRYRAGLAADWNGVPEALRQGVIRLAAHLYNNRDGAEDRGPPAAVAALWRPWRRLRIG